MEFRIRPATIRAARWWPPGHVLHAPIHCIDKGPRSDQPYGVVTLDGWQTVEPGDWIVFGENNEAVVLTHRAFVRLYIPTRSQECS